MANWWRNFKMYLWDDLDLDVKCSQVRTQFPLIEKPKEGRRGFINKLETAARVSPQQTFD